MRLLGRYILRLLAFIGFMTLLGVSLIIWAATHANHGVAPGLPEQMVLRLDLDADFHQGGEVSPLDRLNEKKVYVLPEVVAAIDRAAKDSRVQGLFATMGGSKLGMAGVQEVREAVERFKATGKPAVVFAESISEGGNGTLDTYLASSFGQVWLQPSGEVGLTGFVAESPFLKGTLDLLGIKPEFSGRYQYKSAIETFTESGFTAPHKENVGNLLQSWTDQVVAGIAEGRKLPKDKVRGLMDQGPLLASEAQAAGLVDKLGYRSDALAAAGGGPKPKEVDVGDYAARIAKHDGARIAVITGSGAITRTQVDGPLSEGEGIGADTFAKAIRDAVADPQVKGILLRIDSPGGSYVASDTIWHEVGAARAAGKPVVASFGNVAASGGYFIAMNANRVVAEPGTVTGSIGVFSGKLVMKDFWTKIGANWEEMHQGDNATMWSMNQSFTPAEWKRLDTMLDRIYEDFTTKAATGRNIPPERMDALARGRIWSGADAKDRGLVDKLGGMSTALGEMRDLLKLPADAPLNLVAYPPPKSPLKLLAELLGAVGQNGSVHAGLVTLAHLGPLAARLEALDPSASGELRLPDGAVPH